MEGHYRPRPEGRQHIKDERRILLIFDLLKYIIIYFLISLRAVILFVNLSSTE